MGTDKKTKMTTKTNGVTLALAVFALLAGAAAGASLEQFAAPSVMDEDPYFGVVDDATDAEDTTDQESEDSGVRERIRMAIHRLMRDRIDDRMENQQARMAEHLQNRIDGGNELLTAIEFCLADSTCSADSDTLTAVSEDMEARIAHMEANLEDQANATRFDRGPMDLNSTLAEMMQEKLDRIEAVQAAIDFCLADAACSADSETLTQISDKFDSRADHLEDCLDDGECESEHRGPHRRGLGEHFRQMWQNHGSDNGGEHGHGSDDGGERGHNGGERGQE